MKRPWILEPASGAVDLETERTGHSRKKPANVWAAQNREQRHTFAGRSAPAPVPRLVLRRQPPRREHALRPRSTGASAPRPTHGCAAPALCPRPESALSTLSESLPRSEPLQERACRPSSTRHRDSWNQECVLV